PSADHRRRYRGRPSCDRGRSCCSGHERLLAGQTAPPRNAPRDCCLPQLAAQGNVGAELERARRRKSRLAGGLNPKKRPSLSLIFSKAARRRTALTRFFPIANEIHRAALRKGVSRIAAEPISKMADVIPGVSTRKN